MLKGANIRTLSRRKMVFIMLLAKFAVKPGFIVSRFLLTVILVCCPYKIIVCLVVHS